MKLLFYISSLYGGGAERVVANLANQFCQCGYEVCVVTNVLNSSDYYLDKNVKRLVLTSENERFSNVISKNIKLIKRLDLVIKEFNPLVSISFMGEPNFRLLACRSNTRKIISIRSDPKSEYRGIRGFITKHLFFRCDGVVCQTSDVLNWLKPSIRKKGKVILNQVNPIFYKTERLSSDYYVATGRLNDAKNYELMIDSFHEFLKIHPFSKLLIYGEGKLKQKLLDKIHSNGDEKSILLKGRAVDIPQVLSRAKAFLLTSDYEGMPNGLLEAMAVGLPCISTDCPCGGPRMIIENKINGILIPVGDKPALVQSLCLIEENLAFADKIALEAKRKSLDFEPAKVFEEWKSFIDKVSH